MCSPFPSRGKEPMNSKKVKYNGSEIAVSPEVAKYLEESRKQIESSDRKHREHDVPLVYYDADTDPDTRCSLGKDYLINIVTRNELLTTARKIIDSLPEDMQRLFCLSYEYEWTQQQIADSEHVSKMAICKRLKKLRKLVREKLPDWPEEDFLS